MQHVPIRLTGMSKCHKNRKKQSNYTLLFSVIAKITKNLNDRCAKILVQRQ